MIIDDRDRQSYSYISVVSLNITIIKSTFITGIPNYIQYTVVPWYPWGIISRTLNCGPQNIVFKKSLANSRLFKFSPVLSSRSFIVFVLQLCLWSILVWFLWKVKELCVYFFFACRCPFVPASCVEKTVLSPLICLCSFVKDLLTVFVYFWTLFSLIYLSVLLAVQTVLFEQNKQVL